MMIEDDGGEDFSNPNPAWIVGLMMVMSGLCVLVCLLYIIIRWLP